MRPFILNKNLPLDCLVFDVDVASEIIANINLTLYIYIYTVHICVYIHTYLQAHIIVFGNQSVIPVEFCTILPFAEPTVP